MTIVILDKSITVRTKIVDLLENIDFNSFDINEFEDAELAYDFIRDNSVDLIISSIETDGMDGVDFVELLLGNNPDLVSRLFIITSQKDSEHILEIKDIGAKRFIRKPINEETFNHFIIPEIKKILQTKNSLFWDR